ncbi:MAG: AAA family ATPase [Pseudomonadales bacterium]|nr:AAA family ATPase [Pseudomonadales bacterium]
MKTQELDQYTPAGVSFHSTVRQARIRGENLVQHFRKTNFGDQPPELDILYTPTEAARMVGVSTQAIRTAEEDGRLPQPTRNEKGRKLGYSFHDVQRMRSIFNKMPCRAEDDEVVVLCFSNYKGGAYKTSSSVHFAQGCAEQGYRILFIDLDPQGTASHYFRRMPGTVTTEQTIGPTLLRRDGAELINFEPTQWPNIDLVPASSGLFLVEMEMTRYEKELYGDHGHSSFEALMISLDDLIANYPQQWDMVVIDCPPALGHLTLNAIVASDICIVPTPAHYADYVSTIEYFGLLESMFEALEDSLSIDLRILITRFNSNDDESTFMHQRIKETFKELVLRNVIAYTGEVGKGLIKMRSIYEQPKELRGDRRAFLRARGIFDNVNNEILDSVVKPLWKSYQ